VLATDRRLQVEGRGSEKVLVVVMTDGLENSSTDYDAHTVAELVREYDARSNWTFVYLGAGHANIRAAQRAAAGIGYSSANAMHWKADAESARKTMHSLASATRTRRESRALKSTAFFDEAGQSGADYVEDAPASTPPRTLRQPRPRKRPATIHRRDLGDVLGPAGGTKPGGSEL
jgi:hypothetical protein